MHRHSIGLLTLATLATLLISSCRSGDTGAAGIDAAPPIIDAAPPITDCNGASTVQQVQDGNMPPDTAVALCGVVVTAVDTYGMYTNTMFVQEPDGGEYSGILVYFADAGLPAGVQVGDEVNIFSAVKTEFALNSDTSGETMTELVAGPQPISVEVVGAGNIPAPMVVDPAMLAANVAEAERWESVLVTFENVRTVSTVSRTGDSAHIDVTGPFEVQGNMTDQVELMEIDSCYVSITGVIDYFSGFQLLPRSLDDIVGNGASCRPIETDMALCVDGLDNDLDGFTDCADFGCQATVPDCQSDTTVVQIQDGTIAENTAVTLQNVAVSAMTRDRMHLWIMDVDAASQMANAGPYNGVYVYRGAGAVPLEPAIEVGSVLGVDGRVSEYFGYTEIVDPVITPTGALVPVNSATGVDTGTLGSDATNEPYEGVLMGYSNVPATMVDIDMYGSFLVNDGSGDLRVGDAAFDYASPAQGECFASLVGVMHRFSTGVSFSPRGLEDMVTGGTCN